MTDDQARRLIEIALRRREEMAANVAAIILAAPFEEFVPEIARADFMAWMAEQE